MMTIGMLIEILQKYPREASVVVTQNVVYSEYTAGDEWQGVVGVISWPNENKEETTTLELVTE